MRSVYDDWSRVACPLARGRQVLFILGGDQEGCGVGGSERGCEGDQLADVRQAEGAPVSAVIYVG